MSAAAPGRAGRCTANPPAPPSGAAPGPRGETHLSGSGPGPDHRWAGPAPSEDIYAETGGWRGLVVALARPPLTRAADLAHAGTYPRRNADPEQKRADSQRTYRDEGHSERGWWRGRNYAVGNLDTASVTFPGGMGSRRRADRRDAFVARLRVSGTATCSSSPCAWASSGKLAHHTSRISVVIRESGQLRPVPFTAKCHKQTLSNPPCRRVKPGFCGPSDS